MRWDGWTAGLRDRLLGAPMFVKTMGIALVVGILVGAGLIWQIQHDYYRLEVMEVAGYAQMTAHVLATSTAPLLRDGNLDGVGQLLEEVAHGSLAPQEAGAQDGIAPPHSPHGHTLLGAVNAVHLRDGDGNLLGSLGPVDPQARVREATVPLPADLDGSVTVAVNEDHSEFEVGWHTRRILATAAVMGLIGMGLAWWLASLFTRPIHALVEDTRAVRAGNYQTRAQVQAMDEVGELAVAFNKMMEALQQKEKLNQHLLRKVIAAEEEERKRVARELHDHTGQALTSLIAGLAALENGSHNERLAELRALTIQTLEEVHDLSLTLRPSALEDLGLVPATRKLCQSMARRFGVKVECAAIGLGETARLAGEIEVTLYRIIQEAVTNALRHSQARSIEVLIQRKAASILAVIEDDGQGFDGSDWRAQCLRGDHLGLLGIEERATLLSGTLQVEAQPGLGTHLFVEIPLGNNGHG